MEGTIACAGTLGFFGLLFGFILLYRYLNYRETLALAEKGLVRPPREHSGQGRAALVWGILITAVGLALTLGLWPLGLAFGANEYPLGFGPWMLVGLLPLFFGLALVLVYVLTRNGKHVDTNGGASNGGTNNGGANNGGANYSPTSFSGATSGGAAAEQYPLPTDENL